jgi:UDP-N-acetylglucosamine--N-acetylmuramyl-(pentapeptide) pyrophosphoryl-undecaprenol N-acetylglucosamine transferase
MHKTIVLTGGGSAGHVIPHIALLPLLQSHGYKLHYIGSIAGIEKQIVERYSLPYHAIHSGKLRRYFSLKNFSDPFRIMAGYFQAIRILKKTKPDAVFSKGGFVSVPVVFAAHRLKIPVVLHESDFTPGLANRLCIPKAQKICVSFEDTLVHLPQGKGVYTGTPIREQLFSGDKTRGLSLLSFSGQKPVLLIMGGSLGAQAINEAVDASLDKLLVYFDIAHIRGAGLLNASLAQTAGYSQYEFISENLEHVFAAASIMLSRAGANAVFEILALKIPALLIPLPRTASRGDQILNARYFEKKGYSRVLPQENLSPDTLYTAVMALYASRQDYIQAMNKANAGHAANLIVQEILHAVGHK